MTLLLNQQSHELTDFFSFKSIIYYWEIVIVDINKETYDCFLYIYLVTFLYLN